MWSGRFVGVVGIVVGVVGLAGCNAHLTAGTAAAPTTGPPTPDPACTTIQAAITADLAPIGAALGSAVGAGTAGQASTRRKALAAAGTAITKLGTDVREAGAGAQSATVRSAATDASARLDALVGDPAFLSGIADMAAITAATGQLVQATAGVTRACRP